MSDLFNVMLGILGLWVGTEFAVRAGGEIGRRLGLSELFLGLTVFAIGTDLSELTVAIQGATRLHAGTPTSGLILGNAIGSVLAQAGLVLGIIALFGGLKTAATRSTGATRNALGWLFATGLLWVFAWNGRLGRIEGAGLVAVYVGYLGWLVRSAGRMRERLRRDGALALAGLCGLLGLALALVVGSADHSVKHAVALAERAALDPTAIGLFGIGVGTSLPELAVSIGALARGRPALSIGNVIGSNTFDLLVPIGVAALIHPLEVGRSMWLIDLPAVAAFALYFAVRILRGRRLGGRDALLMLGGYVGFVLFRLGTFFGASPPG